MDAQFADLGRAAVDAGVPNRGRHDLRADATVAVTNILHYLDGSGEEDPASILSSAATHFFAEKETAP
jgi:hypothetical protein